MQVTPETYVRAETDRQFGIVVKLAGGVNRLHHFRRPTPLGPVPGVGRHAST
jgi:hypothetical protein